MATMTVSDGFSSYQSSRFVSTPTTGLKTGLSPSNSSMGEQDNSDKAATSHASINHAHQSSATSTAAPTPQFGVLDLSPQVGVLGPPKDGRVSRDAVPTKLKGKMDQKNGNFGVMHMDIGSRAEPMKQSVAAQRTSENTALAAEVAQREGYISLKKRRLEAQKPSHTVSQVLRPQPPPPPSQPYIPRSAPLTAEQAKYEQARLLTLLRSINPLTVVDQLCKALAFFGGIPSAPPPVDGRFPQSAEANGEGKLFLGWISEIFPDLEKKGGWKKEEPVAPADVNAVRRPRGRPKGSKARKVRSDKGIKKGPLGAARKDGPSNEDDGTADAGNAEADDGWIDVGDTEAQHANANDADTMDVDVLEVVEPTSSAMSSENQRPQEQMSTPVTSKNKGGRPRGSRNKAKSAESTPQHPQSQMASDQGMGLPPPPPGVMQVLARTLADVQPTGGFSGSPTMETPGSSQQGKNKGGRPKGSKNKPKDGQMGLSTPISTDMLGDPQSAVASPSMRGGLRQSNTAIDPFAANNAQVQLTQEERAMVEALRAARAGKTPAPVPQPQPETKKRKRAPRPSAASKAAAAAAAAASQETGVENTNSEPSAAVNGTGNPQSFTIISENQGPNGTAGSTYNPGNENIPPNKAQRIIKDSKPAANKRQSSQNLQTGSKEKVSEVQSSGISTSMSSPQLSLPTTTTPIQTMNAQVQPMNTQVQPMNTQVQPKRPSSQTSHHYQPQQHQFTSLNANHHPQAQSQAAQVALQALQQSQNRQSQQSPIQTANNSATYFSQPHQPSHALSRPSSTHTTSYSPYTSIPSLQQSGRQYSHAHSLSDSLQNDGSGNPNPYGSPSMSSSGGVQSGNLSVGANQGNNGRSSLSVQQHGPPKQQNAFSTSSSNQNIHAPSQNSRHQQNPQSNLSGVIPQQNSHSSGPNPNHGSGQEKNGGNPNPNPYSYGAYPDAGGYLDLGPSSSGVGHSHIGGNNHSHSMSNSLSDGALGHNMFHSSQVGVSNRGGGGGAVGDIGGFGGSGGSVGNGYDLVDNDLRDRLLGGLGRR